MGYDAMASEYSRTLKLMAQNVSFSIKIFYVVVGILTPLAITTSLSQPLQAQDTDLETLCRLFPLNSRCQQVPGPTPVPPAPLPQTQPVPPAPTPAPPTQTQPAPTPSRTLRLLEERTGFGVTGHGGTLGLGAQFTGRITPNLNARIGFNGLSFNRNFTESDIEYDTDVDLRTIPAFVDYFPNEDAGFRITGGLVYNGTQASGVGQTRTNDNGLPSYRIGGTNFLATEVGTLQAEVDFPDFAPYIGVGWGNPVAFGQRWGFFMDVGMMLQRSPNVRLTSPGAGANPALANALQREQEELKDSLNRFRIYPVLQVGVSYQF
jgi:hypothetical protein